MPKSCISFIADTGHWDHRLVLEHMYRGGYQVAEFLPKLGAKSVESLRVKDQPLISIELILLADLAGVVRMRYTDLLFLVGKQG